MAEQPGAREYGRRSRRRGGRKQTCYDFDDSAAQAVRVGGGANMKHKHTEIKIQNIREQ